MIRRFIYSNYPSIIFLAVLIGVIPTESIIALFELRLTYTAPQLLLEEPWRIFTGHIVHSNWAHLSINVFNFLLLAIVFSKSFRKERWVYFTFFSAAFISTGLWITSPLSSYVGFSGIFHGLLLYFLLTRLTESHHKKTNALLLLAIAIFVAKLIDEQTNGPSNNLSLIINRSVASDAHLLGSISGLLFWLLNRFRQR